MSSNELTVDFFCVGAAKAGTTTLHDLLSMQKGVALPRRKETNYFSFGMFGRPTFSGPLDESTVNDLTITSFEDYIDDFDISEGDVVGEVCPSYVLPDTASRIHAHNPDARIIILLREPVSRAFSNYQHLVRDGREYGSFEDALGAEPERLAGGWEWFWGLKKNSQYAEFVAEYIELFGRDRVKILLFEEFVKNQTEHLSDIMTFIGLDPVDASVGSLESNKSGVVSGRWKAIHKLILSDGPVNASLRRVLPPAARKQLGALFKRMTTVKGEITPTTRQHLAEEFQGDLVRLNELTNGKVEHWQGNQHVS